jgi:Family of unknown function (DUF5685)
MFGYLPGASMCCSKAAIHYRAHFCGLGTSLHHQYGAWSRWLVNRDSTFLALLGGALSPEASIMTRSTCCNPWAAPKELLQDGPLLRYVGAVTLCGLNAKLDDDKADERGWRRLLAKAGGQALDAPFGKALGLLHGLNFPVQEVRGWMAGQTQTEYSAAGLIESAHPTSAAYGEIVRHLANLTGALELRTLLLLLGEALGLLIYTQDAWDDWEQDRRRNQYNPLHAYADLQARRAAVLPLMRQAFQRLCAAFEQLPLKRNRDLLQLVLIDGVRQRLDQVEGKKPTSQKDSDSFLRRYQRKGNDCCSSCDCGDCCDCCQCFRGCRLSKGGSICDCNPCDGDGIECCGCDCT